MSASNEREKQARGMSAGNGASKLWFRDADSLSHYDPFTVRLRISHMVTEL